MNFMFFIVAYSMNHQKLIQMHYLCMDLMKNYFLLIGDNLKYIVILCR